MYGEVMKRIIILISFIIAVICLLINLSRGNDLYYAAFTSLCVMLGSSLLLYYTIKGVAMILFSHLQNQSRPQSHDNEDEPLQESKKK